MANDVIQGGSFGTDLPKTDVGLDLLAQERNKARFSKSKEFQKLKEEIEAKIAFYNTCLPSTEDKLEMVTRSKADFEALGQRWVVAATVIAELRSILQTYELAAEVVKQADAQR